MIDAADYADVWVVLPTYDEIENLPAIAPAILERLPGATLLVVDDSSPDGTGDLADRMASENPRVRVLHRAEKQGLGKAYVAGFRQALAAGAGRVVQMDADWSHDPAYLPTLIDLLGGAGPRAEADGAEAGLAIVDRLALEDYRYLHSTRGELLRRLGRTDEARGAYGRALALVHDDAERRLLERRLGEAGTATGPARQSGDCGEQDAVALRAQKLSRIWS